MTYIQNLVEYYDELHPIDESIKAFYSKFKQAYDSPPKLLNIACGTGSLEFELAKNGFDVTGLEVASALLDSANLKRRSQILSIRFFKMSVLDMNKFLGKKFYNVISCLNNRLTFVHDRNLMKKFFSDCMELLISGGTLVLQLYNYKNLDKAHKDWIPAKSSMRVNFYTEVFKDADGSYYLNKSIKNSSGKILPVLQREQIYPVCTEEIEEFANAAGFKNCRFYSDFAETPFTEESPELICKIS